MSEPKVTPSSGNVFADIGLPYAKQLLEESNERIRVARELEEAIDKLWFYYILTYEDKMVALDRLQEFVSEVGPIQTYGAKL